MPAGASREPSRDLGAAGEGFDCRKGDEAGTSTMLGGEEDSGAWSAGRLRIWVGCVVTVSRSRRNAAGEQGMVSPASSSRSSTGSDVRAREGVRGTALECRSGSGEELCAIAGAEKGEEEKRQRAGVRERHENKSPAGGRSVQRRAAGGVHRPAVETIDSDRMQKMDGDSSNWATRSTGLSGVGLRTGLGRDVGARPGGGGLAGA